MIISYGIAGRVGGGPLSLLKMGWDFGFSHPFKLLIDSKGQVGVNMLHISDDRPDILERCLTSVVRLAESGELKPTVGKVFDAKQLAEAHEFLESRKSIGKIAVNW